MILHFTPAKKISKNPRSVISVIFNVALMPDLTVSEEYFRSQSCQIPALKVRRCQNFQIFFAEKKTAFDANFWQKSGDLRAFCCNIPLRAAHKNSEKSEFFDFFFRFFSKFFEKFLLDATCLRDAQ